MERLEELDDQEKFGALNQGYCAQHDHLREQVRHDAKIDGALASVDRVLLDNLTNSINASKHHRDKGGNEERSLGVEGPSSWKNKILQGFVDGCGVAPVLFLENVRFSVGVSFQKSDDAVTINRIGFPMRVNTERLGRTSRGARVYCNSSLDNLR